MKYIIVVDNDRINCQLMKELLYTEIDKHPGYKIMAYYGFCDEECNIDLEQKSEKLIEKVREILEKENDASVHFMFDLLLTTEEELLSQGLADALQNVSSEDQQIASGIKVANKILGELHNDRVEVTFMSKWLNLQKDKSINQYNGIKENALWDSIKYNSIISPINPQHEITNLYLPVPKFGARSLVGILFNVAFDVVNKQGEVVNE